MPQERRSRIGSWSHVTINFPGWAQAASPMIPAITINLTALMSVSFSFSPFLLPETRRLVDAPACPQPAKGELCDRLPSGRGQGDAGVPHAGSGENQSPAKPSKGAPQPVEAPSGAAGLHPNPYLRLAPLSLAGLGVLSDLGEDLRMSARHAPRPGIRRVGSPGTGGLPSARPR